MHEAETDLMPWEQLPNEPPLYYHVFEIFCHLGWERSVRKAAEKWYAETGHPVPKIPGQRFNNAAKKWRWQERADRYWVEERRRAEKLLEHKRNALRKHYGDLGARLRQKIGAGLPNVKVDSTTKSVAEALSKVLELERFGVADTDEDRKRLGRPANDEGALPAIDDVLKPPDEPTEEPMP